MRRFLTAVTAAATLTGGMATGAGLASAAAPSRSVQTVQVTGSHSGLQFSTTHIRAGLVRFRISTTNPNGTGVTLFQFAPGVGFDQLDSDLLEEFSQTPSVAAKGTRDLTRDVRIFGLADVAPGTPAAATVNLNGGDYYSFDSSGPSLPTATTAVELHVSGGDATGTLSAGRHHLASVSLTSDDRFVVQGHLPAHGSVLVRNVADTIHFMTLQRVKPGTTDAEVQAYFDSGAQSAPPFAMDGPSASTDVLSPGHRLLFSYSLPRGTYVLLCFIADDVTGMPHAFMGMHKVVRVG